MSFVDEPALELVQRSLLRKIRVRKSLANLIQDCIVPTRILVCNYHAPHVGSAGKLDKLDTRRVSSVLRSRLPFCRVISLVNKQIRARDSANVRRLSTGVGVSDVAHRVSTPVDAKTNARTCVADPEHRNSGSVFKRDWRQIAIDFAELDGDFVPVAEGFAEENPDTIEHGFLCVDAHSTWKCRN